jgi:hypothetical protein
MVCGFLPEVIFKHLQISYRSVFYERLGARFVQKFVQDGTYINRVMRKNNGVHKVINNRTNASKYLRTIAMYERFHFLCFVFFFLTFINSLFTDQYGPAAFIMVTNIIYNIYPILLQQYNKLRILRLLAKAR